MGRSRMNRSILLACLMYAIPVSLAAQTAKPKLTLDEFFNAVDFPALKISPDGNSVVIEAERADWEQQIFRKELWLYRISARTDDLVQLTQSGRDSAPQWSPDSKWIALSFGAKDRHRQES